MKCILCGKELDSNKESVYIMDYGYLHIDCIKELLDSENRRTRPISYNRLLEIVEKIHLWFFLHTDNEDEVYDEIGITEEENRALGYCSFRSEIEDEGEDYE